MTQRTASGKQQNFWIEALVDLPPLLDSLPDYPRPPVQTYMRDSRCVQLDPALRVRLDTFCQNEGVTLFAVLLSTLNTLLLRHTGQTDLVIGTLSSDSIKPGSTNAPEKFVNLVPIRANLGGNPTARDLLQQVSRKVAEIAGYRDFPFERMLAHAPDGFRPDRAPVFQTMLLLPGQPALSDQPLTAQDIDAVAEHTIRCDLLFLLDGAQLTCQFDSMLFDPAHIERLLGHFQTLLQGIIAAPDTRLSTLPLLTPAEETQLLQDWNSTTVEYPRNACIHHLFQAQAAQTPDAVALLFEGESLTYRQLNQRANQLARQLRHLGVDAEVPVGIFVERSLEMIVGLLAILKAGGAYVPLDTGYPAERIALMLDDTRAPIILTQNHLRPKLPAHNAQVICLDALTDDCTNQPASNLENVTAAENLAYIMYTSGSTGRPKGVSVNHRNVVRLVKGANYARLTAKEIFLQLAPISFDASTLEIWGSLLNGAKLVIFSAHRPTLQELAQTIEQHDISILWLTAGLFHQMVETHPDSLSRVRQLLAGGDVLQVSHVEQMLQKMEGRRLINGYGPTENTTFTCCHPMSTVADVGNTIPIGRPISSTQVYLLDSDLQPVPAGVPGQLYIGGDGLARGYFNRPRLTAESFIPHPFSRQPGERLYKSGDLACYLPDGTLEFLGRMDQQVKIRGFRIEIGEIETVLGRHPAVGEAIVAAHQNDSGLKFLVAYVIPAGSKEMGNQPQRVSFSQRAADLRRTLHNYLREQLPDYMLPAAYHFLEAMPLNPNGKVDRAALPIPDISRPDLEAQYHPPATPVEAVLAGLWAGVLGFEQIGIHDDFFALGGHSLLATQLASRIQQTFRIDIPLHVIFEAPTIKKLAVTLAQYESAPGQLEATARLRQKLATMSPEEVKSILRQKKSAG